MSSYERLLRPILFRLNPESAHNLALWAVAKGLVKAKLLKDPRLEREVFGLHFANPLGLAAGFDKNAVAVSRWAGLGFGFAEVGTVTWHAQPGNPKPRMFRLPKDQALINRLGFNNSGAEAMSRLLAKSKATIPIGINIGKSRVAKIEEASADYVASLAALADRGSYFVLNVSSPNTPGLRSLQQKERLEALILSLKPLVEHKPLLIKVSPDLSSAELDDVMEVAAATGIAGIVATNTTLRRDGLSSACAEKGGLSGKPLQPLADECIRYLASIRVPGISLIGVGGIFTGRDLVEKLALGADLAQIYTGWVYRGPGAVPRILLEYLTETERRAI